MSKALIKVENLSKKFCRDLKRSMWYGMKDLGNELLGKANGAERILRKSEFWALRNVNFELKRKECLGLIGHNGAGKTTLLRMLNGLIKPDSGCIEINGRVCALIALGAGFNPILTGRENVYVNASVMGLSKKEMNAKFEEIVEFSELEKFIDTPVQNYSSGMQVRLGFAVATAMEPDVLLLDEVLAVGDASFRIKCMNRIGELLKKTAVIFVSHQISQIARICTDLILLDSGKVTYKGKNVTKGIDCYYSQINRTELSIHGNGDAEIHKVEVFKSNQNCNDDISSDHKITVEYLDDISVVVYFSISKEITNAIMSISFHTVESRGIAQCYSKNCDFEINNLTDIIKVMVKIPDIQFNPGLYSISINIVDQTRRELLVRHESVKVLQVTGNFVGDCPVQLHGVWKYIS